MIINLVSLIVPIAHFLFLCDARGANESFDPFHWPTISTESRSIDARGHTIVRHSYRSSQSEYTKLWCESGSIILSNTQSYVNKSKTFEIKILKFKRFY